MWCEAVLLVVAAVILLGCKRCLTGGADKTLTNPKFKRISKAQSRGGRKKEGALDAEDVEKAFQLVAFLQTMGCYHVRHRFIRANILTLEQVACLNPPTLATRGQISFDDARKLIKATRRQLEGGNLKRIVVNPGVVKHVASSLDGKGGGKRRMSAIMRASPPSSRLRRQGNTDALTGYLLKKRHNMSIWQRRYFRIQGTFLMYHQTETSTHVVKAAIDLRQLALVSLRAKRTEFQLVLCEKKVYKLRAPTEAAARKWVKGLREIQLQLIGEKESEEEEEEEAVELFDPSSDAPLLKKWAPIEAEAKLIKEITKFRSRCAEHIKENPQFKSASYALHVARSDRICVRFLESTKENIDDAVQKFKEALVFRDQNRWDHILDRPFPVGAKVYERYPGTWHKTTKDGWLVFVDRPGLLDPSMLAEVGGVEAYVQWHFHFMEYQRRRLMPACSEKAGANRDQCVNVLDLRGLGMRHFTSVTKSYFSIVSAGDAKLYCGMSKEVVLVNAPRIFRLMWTFIKPLLHESVRSKVHIFGDSGMNYLDKIIGKENVPEFLGGTCTCSELGEGGCLAMSPQRQEYIEHMKLGDKVFMQRHAPAFAAS